MNAHRSLAKHVLLAGAVASATVAAAVAAPRLAAASPPAGPSNAFGSNVAVSVAPARAIDVDTEAPGQEGLNRVACAAASAEATGTRCFVSAG